MLRAIAAGFLDLLAPPTCAACDALLASRSDGFCFACAPLLEPLPVPDRDTLDRASHVYGGPLADALHRLKYGGASTHAPALARLFHDHARALAGRVQVVAVVPLSPRRLRERGYNQSALLAAPVARTLSVPFRPHWLRRVRETAQQVGSPLALRATQLEGAFAAHPRVRDRVVLVVDDVRTTGATLREARRALLAAGARDVLTLTLAYAPGPTAVHAGGSPAC